MTDVPTRDPVVPLHETDAKVGVIMGSKSDWELYKSSTDLKSNSRKGC